MRIISRREWGARYPDGFAPAPLPASRIYLHHSGGIAPDLNPPFDDDYAAIRQLENIGQSRFGGGISYTYLITPIGLIFQGHSDGRQGAHTGGLNDVARAICLVGNYETARPTAAQIVAVRWLLADGRRRGVWNRKTLTGPHSDVKATACPGMHARAAIPEMNRPYEPTPHQEDDMLLTDKLTVGRWVGTTVGQVLDAVMTTTQGIPALTGRVAALEAAVAAVAAGLDNRSPGPTSPSETTP